MNKKHVSLGKSKGLEGSISVTFGMFYSNSGKYVTGKCCVNIVILNTYSPLEKFTPFGGYEVYVNFFLYDFELTYDKTSSSHFMPNCLALIKHKS